MAFWLVKSEPDAWSWAQHLAQGVEPWTGVRNHLARNHLRTMGVGDQALFYHSNIGREVVGVVEVVRAAYPDPTMEPDGKKGDWVCVDMRALHPLPRPVSLPAIKADPALREMALVRFSRLSVGPVTAAEWARVLELGGHSPSEQPGGQRAVAAGPGVGHQWANADVAER